MPVIVATGPTLKIDPFLLLLKNPFLTAAYFSYQESLYTCKISQLQEVYDSSALLFTNCNLIVFFQLVTDISLESLSFSKVTLINSSIVIE